MLLVLPFITSKEEAWCRSKNTVPSAPNLCEVKIQANVNRPKQRPKFNLGDGKWEDRRPFIHRRIYRV
jgi:hypothetical protein